MNTRSKVIYASLSLGAALFFSSPVLHAQSGDGSRPKKERREGAGAERLERLREMLGLSEAQVAQLKEIFAAERAEMQAKAKELGRDADRSERREAARAIHQSYVPKIEAVLTPEQREQWAQIRERARERRDERAGGPGGPGSEGKKRGGPGDMEPEEELL
jgi:Spy/CpxP family protein refolding chaperone